MVSPSDVANTVVPASEPRLPKICTLVVIGALVGFVNVSIVRAKSSLPVFGTVILRETDKPENVPLPVTRLWPSSLVLDDNVFG